MLICIDDVESIIEAETAASANATPPPSRLIGVPPSKGRGGNQTPRSESILITGSRPLPSPSSSMSFGSSPKFDKLAFGMSKIDGDTTSKPGSFGSGSALKENSSGSAPAAGAGIPEASSIPKRADSTEATAARISDVSLDPGFDKMPSPHPANPPGPSLLTQMAPNQPAASSSSSQPQASSTTKPAGSGGPISSDPKLSISGESPQPSFGDTSTTSSVEGMEKITVKIADLGNGTS